MSKFKFELNRDGVRELMQGQTMQEILKTKASEIQRRAGEGFESDIHVGKTRANAMVYPGDPKAYFRNLKSNILLKAIK